MLPREGMQVLFGDREDRFASYLRTGVAYAKRPTRDLHMSILSPVPPKEENIRGIRNPLMVFVQGSGFNEQDLSLNIPLLAEFAHHGFVVASVQCRPATEVPFPGQIDDLRLALHYLEKNAHSIGADATRIGLCGGSSGAHTVVMLTVTAWSEELGGEVLTPHVCDIKAVVDFFGPVDLVRLEETLPDGAAPRFADGRRNLLGGTARENPELAQMANPITHLSTGRPLPPFLIVHGDEDEMVPHEQSRLLYEALVSTGHRAFFVTVRGGRHGRNIFTREIVHHTISFLRGYL